MAQTVGATTTNFALDVLGLPEVISTTNGTTYLYLPGVIVAQNSAGERVYLLPNGLDSNGATIQKLHSPQRFKRVSPAYQ
ncbi:MAG: hypothetical protein Fur0044_00840 [Anaerolineae bacterium]